MLNIFDKLSEKFTYWRKEANEIVKKSGKKVISEVTISQAYSGMRGVRALICDTSRVPKDEGLIIRGKHLKELTNKSPEEIYYLLLTGELPAEEELDNFSDELKRRKNIPDYVWNILKSMPKDSHPMTMLDTAILSMQRESVFASEYNKGIKKEDYWKPTLEDALNIVARMPAVAAAVYRIRFNKGEIIEPDLTMDLSGDYVHMLGIDIDKDEFYKLMKLYLVLHCDHEGGNVSALTTQTINSALSDLYYSLSGGFNGLAGPLHGLANQETLKWVMNLIEKFNGTPTTEQLRAYVKEAIDAGKIISGYGHAVLRITDPRFEAFLEFGKKYLPDDPVFLTVTRLYEVVPAELRKIEKIKNPYPNVDAISGSLLYHYGLKEALYYTVVFAVSRSLGLTAQAVINRGMMFPLIRPKSVTTEYVKGQ
jgi:citrate synthase